MSDDDSASLAKDLGRLVLDVKEEEKAMEEAKKILDEVKKRTEELKKVKEQILEIEKRTAAVSLCLATLWSNSLH